MNLFHKFVAIVFIGFCLGCKSEVKNKSMSMASLDSTSFHSDPTPKKAKKKADKAFWQSVGYKKMENFNSDYDDAYAEEISKFIHFRLSQDTLQIGDCELTTYTYNYSTTLTYYGTESVFITAYKPQTEKAMFISTIDSGQKYSCFPFDQLLFYQPSKDKLILFDRSYLFEFESVSEKIDTPSYIKELKGIPGNNREEWLVGFEQNDIADYSEAIQFFKKEFPYGGKNINPEWRNQENDPNDAYAVNYEKVKNTLFISKRDPMGTITIALELTNQTLKGTYHFEFPEY